MERCETLDQEWATLCPAPLGVEVLREGKMEDWMVGQDAKDGRFLSLNRDRYAIHMGIPMIGSPKVEEGSCSK